MNHRIDACRDEFCGYCETRAEQAAHDDTPDYDLDAAADQYERQFES